MTTQDDQAVAAGHSVDPDRWVRGFDELMGRISGRFGRVEPRRRVRSMLLGLLAGLSRTNCWTIAEHAGDTSPDGMQHLLGRAVWDHDAVREDLRSYVLDHLGAGDAVLVVDLCRHRDYAEELAAARAWCPCGACVEWVSEGLISA